MPVDTKTNKHKGFAFIGFASAESKTAAIAEDHEVRVSMNSKNIIAILIKLEKNR